MCIKCDEINATIARYRRLREQINDPQTHEAAARLMAELETKRLALHPEK